MILEEKINFHRAVLQRKGKGIVYELFNKYEEAYLKIHNPTTRHKKEYVDMYVLFQNYINGERKKKI